MRLLMEVLRSEGANKGLSYWFVSIQNAIWFNYTKLLPVQLSAGTMSGRRAGTTIACLPFSR